MSSKDNPTTELNRFVSSNGRVCPLPQKWHEFWLELCSNEKGLWPPKPIILSGWWYSKDRDKAKRLKEQIAFASESGILEKADDFLRSIESDEWHYKKIE